MLLVEEKKLWNRDEKIKKLVEVGGVISFSWRGDMVGEVNGENQT